MLCFETIKASIMRRTTFISIFCILILLALLMFHVTFIDQFPISLQKTVSYFHKANLVWWNILIISLLYSVNLYMKGKFQYDLIF